MAPALCVSGSAQLRFVAIMASISAAAPRVILQDNSVSRSAPLEPNWSHHSASDGTNSACSAVSPSSAEFPGIPTALTCTIGQSRLSHALPALRQAGHGGAFRDFVLGE
eukprot:scaffold50879_cov37-Prasinocladus_malaysianus.AAC.2